MCRAHIDGEKKLVSELQRGLGIRVNGRFGGRTESAVIDWQAIHNKRGEVVPFGKGLTIDGRVDRNLGLYFRRRLRERDRPATVRAYVRRCW